MRWIYNDVILMAIWLQLVAINMVLFLMWKP
jgi:hypothetical protein